VARPGLYCAIMLLLIGSGAYAQLKCKVEHYSTEDGLSHNRVMCMIKDREGFMWFGTWDGINRFDGHNFTVYKSRPGDTSSLKNNRVDEIVEDKAGYLWLRAYDNRIYRFDKKKEQFLAIAEIPVSAKASQPLYNHIVLSETGQIWLMTKNQGIFLIAQPDSPHPQYIRFSAELSKESHLPSNTINFFYEDDQSDIWIGTPSGICCLKKGANGNYSNINLGADLSAQNDFTCAVTTGNKLWFGTGSGDLICYDKPEKKVIRKKISAYSLNALCVSKKSGNIYLSSSGGEVIWVDRATMQTGVSKMPETDQFASIYEDRSGLLWIEPQKPGIVKFDPVHNTFKRFHQRTDAYYNHIDKVYKVFEDKNGLVWMSMQGGGFGYYNAATDDVNYFYNEPGSDTYHFSNIVICSYLDPAGILWLNTDDKGLNKVVFQRNDFNQKLIVDHTVIRSDNEIRGICYDNKNRLWLASKSAGLYVYNNKDQQVNINFINKPTEGLGVIYCILPDKKGNIWLGTRGNGLFKAEPVDAGQATYKLSHYLANKNNIYSLSSNTIYSLLEDKKGRVWIGTYEAGLNLVDIKDGQMQFVNIKNSFRNYPKGAFVKIRHLQEDAKGKLWIATTDGLLVLDADNANVNNYSFTSFSKIAGDKESLGKNDVQFIYRDSENSMWLCTSGGGLNKAIGDDPFKSLKFKVYTTEDGLTSDYILSCVQDNNGNLWLATENGLSKFNAKTSRFINYDSYDGLPKTGFSEASALKLPNGNLVFGGITGYVSFNPAGIVNHKINVSMALTNLQINNEDVKTNADNSVLKLNINDAKDIQLKYNENIISIDYTVLDYRLGNKQLYAYRLNSFDKKWHDNQGQRRATYTNLPPGDYTFEVKSLNGNLYDNTPYKSLAITILPPPWLTWWAYLIYAVLAVVLVEVARRIALTMLKLRHRIAVEQKLAELKLSFFTNVSHELRTPLTLILNPIEEIYKKETLSVQGNEHINVVRKNAKRMVRFINQLLDLRKVQSGKAILKVSQVDMVSFVKKISEYFIDVAREKHIDLEIIAADDELYVWIDAEKMDIVIYNLLANAFKFTPAGKQIKVFINKIGQSSLSVEIFDQGQGVPEDKLSDIFEIYYEGDHTEGKNLKGTGIGLALSKELVELHHGKISAKNNADKGLTVSIELKTGNEHLKRDQVVFVDLPELPHELEETLEELLIHSPQQAEYHHNSNIPLVLLVEDNKDLRTFLNTQLSEFYRVEVAENGEEGLQKALKCLPDLILSDVMMPKMDGIQMLDRLKNDSRTSHIPVVLLTAKFSVESQIEGLKYGADFYITKPFQNDLLLASIQNLISQRKKIFELLLSKKRAIELNPGEITITPHDEVFLQKIIKIVEEHMSDLEFNIDAVAESINMGRSTFYKKFKSLTNLAPVEFVREMRLKRAKQYLDAGEHNIAEIAYSVGFNNAKYFSTCFREQFQVSPSEYLKMKTTKT